MLASTRVLIWDPCPCGLPDNIECSSDGYIGCLELLGFAKEGLGSILTQTSTCSNRASHCKEIQRLAPSIFLYIYAQIYIQIYVLV